LRGPYKEKLLPIIREIQDDSEGNGPNPLRTMFPTLAKFADKLFGSDSN
jgi:hypothetical protein